MSRSKKAKEPRPIRSRPSIFSVSPEVQKQCYDKERIILECIALREANAGRLPRDERAKAATELRVAGRMVNTLIDDYLAYCEAFPDQPSVNAFVPQRMGRPKSTRLIDEQAMVAVFAYLNPSWISIIEDGPVKDVKLRARLGTIRLFFAPFFDADTGSFGRRLGGACSPSAGWN